MEMFCGEQERVKGNKRESLSKSVQGTRSEGEGQELEVGNGNTSSIYGGEENGKDKGLTGEIQPWYS